MIKPAFSPSIKRLFFGFFMRPEGRNISRSKDTHPTHRCAGASGFALLILPESVSDSGTVQPEMLMPQGVALVASGAVNRFPIHFSKAVRCGFAKRCKPHQNRFKTHHAESKQQKTYKRSQKT